jgi:3-hydroxymyristoyl/3-hydroxydecanoyl-(acyl carrier protein) dehydratase
MRYRFVDEILAVEADPPRITISKTFDVTDDAFSGPAGRTRLPNSLILELLATTGGLLVLRRLGDGRVPLLMKVDQLTFGPPALPGGRLRAHAELRGVSLGSGTTLAETAAEVHGDEGLVAAGRLLYLCTRLPCGIELAAEVPR